MTLDEAIEHAEGVASNCEGECADEHRQLAEWLREMKRLKSQNERLRKENTSLRQAREREFAASCEAATNHMLEVGKLRDENAKLRNENAKLREYAHTLEVANIEVTSRLTDYIGQYDPTEAYVIEAQTENARLRELVKDMWICVSHGSGWDCTGCGRDPDSVCIDGISEFSRRMRELGIEVQL